MEKNLKVLMEERELVHKYLHEVRKTPDERCVLKRGTCVRVEAF